MLGTKYKKLGMINNSRKVFKYICRDYTRHLGYVLTWFVFENFALQCWGTCLLIKGILGPLDSSNSKVFIVTTFINNFGWFNSTLCK